MFWLLIVVNEFKNQQQLIKFCLLGNQFPQFNEHFISELLRIFDYIQCEIQGDAPNSAPSSKGA